MKGLIPLNPFWSSDSYLLPQKYFSLCYTGILILKILCWACSIVFPKFPMLYCYMTSCTTSFYLSLLDPSIRANQITPLSLQMLKVCDDYLTGGHCHRFTSAVLSCCSLSSEITAHLSKQTWCWCCGNPSPRFTCWPSNQIQPRCGPHLGPALSAPVSSDNPFLNQPP